METVNVAEQVLLGSQVLVTVKVTVTVPPQAGGAPVLLFDMAALHPPENVAVANHAVNFELIAACVWQEASVEFAGQVNTTGVDAVTVNTAEQVTGEVQSLVTVKVTVLEPPQAEGAPLLLLEIEASQPPVNVAVANQAVNLESMAACVWQAASVTFDAQVRKGPGNGSTLIVCTQVAVFPQLSVAVQVLFMV